LVVLAWRGTDRLLDCLSAVADTCADQDVEVILLLNGASAPVEHIVRDQVTGARVLNSSTNLGFAAGCNRAAEVARGDFLVFLNDDVIPEPGWLAALIARAGSDPKIGAVGGRLVFPDGRLQEAGCLLWADGSTHQVGWGEPDDGNWTEPRDVAYCSAACLLVRRTAFAELGGFDPRFFPAYFEDADLCLRLWRGGSRVVYEPAARIVHAQSASSHDDFRTFLYRSNQALFVRRWQQELADAPAKPSDSELSTAVHRAVLEQETDWLRSLPREEIFLDPPRNGHAVLAKHNADLEYLRRELEVLNAYTSDLYARHQELNAHCHQVAEGCDWLQEQRRALTAEVDHLRTLLAARDAELQELNQARRSGDAFAAYELVDSLSRRLARHPRMYGMARAAVRRLARRRV
jgi:GT2 family glycosyltransferase